MSNSDTLTGRNNSAPHRFVLAGDYVGPKRSKFGVDYFQHAGTGLRVEIVESSSRNPAERDEACWTVKARTDGKPARQVHQHYVTERSVAFEIAAEWMQEHPEGQLPETWFDFSGAKQTEGDR